MNFNKYAAGIFVFAGILSLFLANGGNSISQYANAQSTGEQIGDTIGGALDELGEGVGNATETLSEAGSNATESMSGAINETGQAADNATSTGGNATNSTSENPLDMLMNLFK